MIVGVISILPECSLTGKWKFIFKIFLIDRVARTPGINLKCVFKEKEVQAQFSSNTIEFSSNTGEYSSNTVEYRSNTIE